MDVSPLFAVLVVIVLFVIVTGLFTVWNRSRLLRRASTTDDEAQRLQAGLLDAIKVVSGNRRTVVDIRPFWSGSKVPAATRYAVAQALIDEHYVSEHQNRSQGDFENTLTDWFNFAFLRPPTHLILNDVTWERMVNEGVSGWQITIERLESMNWQSAGGDINNSPQTNAGGDVDVNIDSIARTETKTSGISAAELKSLVAALRTDASGIEDKDFRAKIRSLANKLEGEADDEDVDEENVEDSLTRVQKYLHRAGDILSTTKKVFDMIGWTPFS